MAIAITSRTFGAQTTNGTTYVTDTGGDGDGTFTPGAGSLLLASVSLAGDATDPTSLTGHGATWVKLKAQAWATTFNLSIWGAFAGASPTDSTVSVAAGASRTGGIVAVAEVTGAYVSGTVAQAAIQGTGAASSGTTPAVTLSAASNAANRTYFTATKDTTTATIAVAGSMTGLVATNTSHANPDHELRNFWRSDAFETGPTATITSTNWGAVAVEIVEASAGAPTGVISVGFIPI